MTRGNKQVVPISIKNKTYYINQLLVDAIAILKLKTEDSYEQLEETTQEETRAIIRNLVIAKDSISTQIIEDEIYLACLSKKFREKLKSLDNRQ